MNSNSITEKNTGRIAKEAKVLIVGSERAVGKQLAQRLIDKETEESEMAEVKIIGVDNLDKFNTEIEHENISRELVYRETKSVEDFYKQSQDYENSRKNRRAMHRNKKFF